MLAAIIYAAFFWGIGGQVIGHRTLERSGWLAQCEQAVVIAARQDKPDLQFSAPTPDCNAVMEMFAGQDGEALCDVVGGLFENPLASQIETQNQRLIEAHKKRIQNAASHAVSQCTCAVNVALENRNSWAIHAGSFRLINPAPVANVEAELSSALNSDFCRGEFQ